MLKVRIIPTLTFNGFALVKTRQFSNPRMVGNPIQVARVYNSRQVDELLFLDITASQQNRKINLSIVQKVLKECSVPLGVGGGIETLEDIRDLLKIGADKVVLKSIVWKRPEFIYEASRTFGAQAITIAVDAKQTQDGSYEVVREGFNPMSLQEFVNIAESQGGGELIVNSIDKEGEMNGFDIPLISKVLSTSSLPVIACGGGGNPSHFRQLFSETKVKAVAAGSIFHFTQYTPKDIKDELQALGLPVRLQ